MKTKIFFISLCVLAAVGIGFIVYPNIADYINSKSNETVIKNYSESTQTMSDYEIDNELAKAQNFNELLAKSALNDEEKNEYNAAMSEYENILNYDDIMCCQHRRCYDSYYRTDRLVHSDENYRPYSKRSKECEPRML